MPRKKPRDDLAGKSPKELDKLTTEWLKRHDKRPKESHDNDGPVIEWDISPVSTEVEGDDDTREIADTFANLSGGDRAFSFYAALGAEDARGLEARREYMRRTRQHDPSKRRRWRANEKQRRRAKRFALTRIDDITERSTAIATTRERAHQRRRRRKSRIRKEHERQTTFSFFTERSTAIATTRERAHQRRRRRKSRIRRENERQTTFSF